MTAFTNIQTGGADGSAMSDPMPIPTMRGFQFNANGTKSLIVPAGTYIGRVVIMPVAGVAPTAGTVKIGVNGGSATRYANATVLTAALIAAAATVEQIAVATRIDFTVAALSVGSAVRVALEIIDPTA